jgi:hypothetical protein
VGLSTAGELQIVKLLAVHETDFLGHLVGHISIDCFRALAANEATSCALEGSGRLLREGQEALPGDARCVWARQTGQLEAVGSGCRQQGRPGRAAEVNLLSRVKDSNMIEQGLM